MKLKSSFILALLATHAHASVEFLRADLNAIERSHDKDDHISGFIEGQSNQFNENIGNVPGNRYNGSVFFDYHKNPREGIERRFTAAGLYNDQNLFMYSLQEAYLAKRFSRFDHEIKVGRQILDWSPIDSMWGFGKLNNRRNFTGFEPGLEGLTGINLTLRSGTGWRVKAFGSALYVPEMNPGLDIDKKNKTITSRNPWANPPSATTTLEGKEVPISYNVEYPEVNDVIFRYSGGINIGFDTDHISTDAFFMRKPENQISALADVKFDAINNVVNASVTPQFYYHDLYGSSIRYHNQGLAMYLGAIAIRPNTFPDGDEDATSWTQIPTEKRREDYAGGGISMTNDIQSYGINYVARLSPYDRVLDKLAEDPRWNQAIDVFYTRQLTRRLSFLSDLKYDMLTTDRLVMVKGVYSPTNYLQLGLGVNMIGTPVDGRSYWSTFTNNDQIYASMRMIF